MVGPASARRVEGGAIPRGEPTPDGAGMGGRRELDGVSGRSVKQGKPSKREAEEMTKRHGSADSVS